MDYDKFLKAWLLIIVFIIGAVILLGPPSHAQVFPTSYYYTNPLFYTNYGYFNTINGYLLGYGMFSPFLTTGLALAYNSLGIPTYPYFGSPYQTTFPYTTLPGTPIPYARFDYPSYVYGSPDYYLSWVLLQ